MVGENEEEGEAERGDKELSGKGVAWRGGGRKRGPVKLQK